MSDFLKLLAKISLSLANNSQLNLLRSKAMVFVKRPLTLADLPAPPEGKIGWPWTEQSEPLGDRMSDGSEWPRVSIVTASYNYGQFIEETIRSALLQSYPNLEYIIIDGGSTDNTVEIIRKYEKFLTYWVSKPDNGQTDALNIGYKCCTGDLFAWLNADDAYMPTCLHDVAESYKQGYELVVGECVNVDENNHLIKITKEFNGYAPPQSFDDYIRFWSFVPLPQPAVFVAKRLADQSFPIDESLYFTMDYQFFLRILSQNPKSIWLQKTWVKFRYHGNNKTLEFSEGSMYVEELYKISLLEAERNYKYCKRLLFQVSAKDHSIIRFYVSQNTSLRFREILLSLIHRPTILRWPLFLKLFLKSFFGNGRYMLLKKIISILLRSN